ncbi:hypothetical protein SAMN05421825_0715 [Epilithonimonas hungarica]|uniref:Uncharacterized protein n=1 Tax=Epilithonimonas hungarica TaxID=454006 RepID=A0A1G7H826_9FLAO|nr:hypothetical protein SAMN05421825_0715 [Epilithonimonas hungarica]
MSVQKEIKKHNLKVTYSVTKEICVKDVTEKFEYSIRYFLKLTIEKMT